jgi:hypothetical protein
LGIFLYNKILLLVESFDLRPSNQYILVRVSPSCFRFAKMRLYQVSFLSWFSPRYSISPSWESCTLFVWTGEQVSLVIVNVAWTDLDPLAFILQFLNRFYITSRLVCSFFEAMSGSLSVATTAVPLANVDYGSV